MKTLARDTVLIASSQAPLPEPLWEAAFSVIRKQVDDAQQGYAQYAGPGHERDRIPPVKGNAIRLTWEIVEE